MRKKVPSLEYALRTWETMCVVTGIMNEYAHGTGHGYIFPAEGPVIHAPEFRRYLLESMHSETFDADRFLGPKEVKAYLRSSGSAVSYLPIALANWTRKSRRVYKVSEELQYLLQLTSLKDVRWSDLELPFDAFVLDLEVPFFDSKGRAYDSILVSRDLMEDGNTYLAMRLLCTQLERIKVVPENERLAVWRSIEHKRWDQVMGFLKRWQPKKEITCSVVMIGPTRMQDLVASKNYDLAEEQFLDQLHGRESNVDHNEWQIAGRLVAGFCLYLKTLPPGNTYQSPWQKHERSGTPDTKAITDIAEVCLVKSAHSFSPEEWSAIRNVGLRSQHRNYELCAHFREGHWRRPPGQGNDPAAKKTVHVRPTLVRFDRLEPGSIPEGAQKSL